MILKIHAGASESLECLTIAVLGPNVVLDCEQQRMDRHTRMIHVLAFWRLRPWVLGYKFRATKLLGHNLDSPNSEAQKRQRDGVIVRAAVRVRLDQDVVLGWSTIRISLFEHSSDGIGLKTFLVPVTVVSISPGIVTKATTSSNSRCCCLAQVTGMLLNVNRLHPVKHDEDQNM